MKELILKMVRIQSTLKAPKGQWNDFSKYKYRSCEDIVEAVKPLLAQEDLFMMISDKVIHHSDTRCYVEATVTITDGKHSIEATASAREAVTKKGMDDSQLTGATSSYARKYALNGMFGIDDTKDADTADNRTQPRAVKAPPKNSEIANVMSDGNDLATAQFWRSMDQEKQNKQWKTLDKPAQTTLKAIMSTHPA